MRDYYSLATSQRESGTAGFPPDAKDDLREAAPYWKRYQAVADKPEPGHGAATRFRSTTWAALNQPKEAQQAAAILAEDAQRHAVVPAAWFHTRRVQGTRVRPIWLHRRRWTWRRRRSAS